MVLRGSAVEVEFVPRAEDGRCSAVSPSRPLAVCCRRLSCVFMTDTARQSLVDRPTKRNNAFDVLACGVLEP